MYLKYRSPIMIVLLSMITCGIYSIYYIITLQNDIRDTYKREDLPSGLVTWLLSIITCGIYGYYWMYKTTNIVSDILMDHDIPQNNDDAILYTILGIFLSPLAFYALIQSKINQIAPYNDQNERY